MAGDVAWRFGAMKMRTSLLVLLFLLLSSGHLHAVEQTAEVPKPPPGPAIQPTRASIYQHLTDELRAALGAEEHVKNVFAGIVGGMREALSTSVPSTLQGMVDTVVEKAEDHWVAADDAGRALDVRPCVDGAELEAQQVAKRALEKARGCVEAVDEEGARRAREAARLLNDIEGVSKRFVTALEACVKEEEAKEAAAPPAPAPADAAATTADADSSGSSKDADATPAQDASGGKTSKTQKTKDAAAEAATTDQQTAPTKNVNAKQRCKACETGSKREKSVENKLPRDEVVTVDEPAKKGKDRKKGGREETVSQEVENQSEDNTQAENVPTDDEKSQKYNKEFKGKKGKEEKVGKLDGSKQKEKDKRKKGHSTSAEETVEEVVPEKTKDEKKDKGKHKKGKDGELADKKVENVDEAQGGDNSAQEKDKKSKKQSKKEEGKSKKTDNEERKGRKKRDLLAFNEEPQEKSDQQQESTAEQPEEVQQTEKSDAEAGTTRWPQEGATPEERRVIACMRSATMQPLVEEKNRAYQRLQAVLQRTAAKEQDAPSCITDHVRKADLKISAIKQRMASCAERKMRQEL